MEEPGEEHLRFIIDLMIAVVGSIVLEVETEVTGTPMPETAYMEEELDLDMEQRTPKVGMAWLL